MSPSAVSGCGVLSRRRSNRPASRLRPGSPARSRSAKSGASSSLLDEAGPKDEVVRLAGDGDEVEPERPGGGEDAHARHRRAPPPRRRRRRGGCAPPASIRRSARDRGRAGSARGREGHGCRRRVGGSRSARPGRVRSSIPAQPLRVALGDDQALVTVDEADDGDRGAPAEQPVHERERVLAARGVEQV